MRDGRVPYEGALVRDGRVLGLWMRDGESAIVMTNTSSILMQHDTQI